MHTHTHTHGQISLPGFEVETAVVAAVVVLAVVALGSSFNTFTGNIHSLPPIFPLIQSSLTHPGFSTHRWLHTHLSTPDMSHDS